MVIAITSSDITTGGDDDKTPEVSTQGFFLVGKRNEKIRLLCVIFILWYYYYNDEGVRGIVGCGEEVRR